jgi:peptide/nickel transport system substrate-binding protein
MKAKHLVCVVWIVVLAGLAACSAPPVPASRPAASSTEVTPAIPAVPASTGAPAGPDVLRVRLRVDLINADPAFHPAGPDTLVAETVGQGLVSFRPGTWELTNVLAESIESSPDGLQIAFKLREGVQFHGGYGELTAEDVKFSYERFLDPQLNAPYKGDWEALDQVEVTGRYTGVIKLKRIFAPLWTSTLPATGGIIVSKKAVQELGDGYGTHPIGTGPYYFAEWKPSERIVLKRFEGFWGARPEWDEIDIIPISDDNAADIALETGEVDVSAIAQSSIPRFASNPRFTVLRAPTLNYRGVFMNVQHPKLKDIRVRQAIRYAIDADAINVAAFEGALPRMCAIVAPGQIGYWQDAPCYARDVEKAKALLDQAGVSSLDLTLTALQNDTQRTMAEVIQANLSEVGVNVEIISLDGGAYNQGGFGEKGMNERQLTLFDWGTTNPDPHWQMMWFSCDQVGQYNWMYWCDERFDALNTEAASTLDPARRGELYIDSQRLWDQNANVVWLLRPIFLFGMRSDIVPSFNPNAVPYLWDFKSK